MKRFPVSLLYLLVLLPASHFLSAQQKKPLGIEDIMRFRQVESPSISRDGCWVVHTARPDRGDPEVLVYSTDGKQKYSIPRGEKPVISNDGNWVAAVHAVSAVELLKKKPAKVEKPAGGLILLNLATGEQSLYKRVQSFAFSEDGKWLFIHEFKEKTKKEADGKDVDIDVEDGPFTGWTVSPDSLAGEKEEQGKTKGRKNLGATLQVISLTSELRYRYPFVTKYSADSLSRYLAFVVADSTGAGNAVRLAELGDSGSFPVYADSLAWADCLSWNNRTGGLAFLAGTEDEKGNRGDARLFLWSPSKKMADSVLTDGNLEGDWKVYHTNRLRWSKDGKRLFLGVKPASEIVPPEKEDLYAPEARLYYAPAILEDRTVDVWHWMDPYIIPNQKKRWEREKDRIYTGVFFPGSGKYVRLADREMPAVRISDNPSVLLGSSNVPYARQVTWEGRILDYYLVDLQSGERKMLVEAQKHTVNLSPDGRFAVYYREGDWHLVETSTGEKRNLTESLEVPFSDEDWDYPREAPGYGAGEWLDGSRAVLLYDKYDIWMFPTTSGDPVCLTEGKGREGKYQFRIRRLDRDREFLETGNTVLLTAYHDLEKFTAVYSMTAGIPGVRKLLEGPKKYTLLARAKDAGILLYTRESYTEFPDLWVSREDFRRPRRLSEVNPQVSEFAWGDAELVEWTSMDGIPLQGVLIKPGNYRPGKKYPVLVYFYRFFSNRLYEFNQVVINHRPCFPFYASNGYAVFLPDVRFNVGNPGYSATKCLVPGVQKIIDMGIADPDAICLHGHSWSGYQTAFVITQTDIFACAIAGAPVANMTSAYSGIRWESGLARQMQYERQQSRIGASLWEARDKYIENSPVFFADRIHTPLLIQFGDRDGAVPWYQGIELYLAMRRLGKDCVFLEYRSEPHHLKQYANKLDYTLKFKAWLDHYLKGEPAADWINSGVPYKGK